MVWYGMEWYGTSLLDRAHKAAKEELIQNYNPGLNEYSLGPQTYKTTRQPRLEPQSRLFDPMWALP